MTVQELYEKLELEINSGHGGLPVMFNESWEEKVEIQNAIYYDETTCTEAHIELKRW